MLIRKANMDDLPALQAMYRELEEDAVRYQPEHFVLGCRDAAFFQTIFQSPSQDILVAELNGRPVGFSHIMILEQKKISCLKPQTAAYIQDLDVLAEFRGQGIGSALMQAGKEYGLAHGADFIRTQVFPGNIDGMRFYERNGFQEMMKTIECQFAPPLERAIDKMVSAMAEILAGSRPSIYLYGSCALEDFRLGWSDIDILALTASPVTEAQANELVELRQRLLEAEPGNKYYRSFEGGILDLEGFVSNAPARVVYWGTSGQRITGSYRFDSFSMAELLENGRLLYGDDIRNRLTAPSYAGLCQDVRQHYESIRQHAQTTGRSVYSFGWMLDIARGLYTLRYGKVAPKTAAGQWALEEGLCPVPEALKIALEVRREPERLLRESAVMDRAEALGPDVQRFADVLERELEGRMQKFS